MQSPARRAELAASLDEVHGRIARACTAAGRDPAAVTLVAVTKTYPAGDVALLAGLGVTDVGENRDQEAAPKAAEVAEVLAGSAATVRWHYVGRLQRNKCRSVVGYTDVVQSVDSVRLAQALGAAADRHRDRPLEVFVQISIDGDHTRGGALTDPVADADRAVLRVADAVARHTSMRLGGVMAVAPIDRPADAAFEELARVAERLRVDHPTATAVSAGMSGDLEAAVRYGATHVRIGSALLGMRNTLR